MPVTKLPLVLTATAVSLWFCSHASAQECGTYHGTSGNDIILIGEAVDTLLGFTYRTGRVAVCRKTGSSFVYTEIPTCDDTTQWDLLVLPQQGNDVIAPVVSNIRCGSAGPHVVTFSELVFGFGFTVVGDGSGTGGDTIYGTQNDDYLMSLHGNPGASDNAGDLLCGYEGNDTLFGDSSSTRERMSGGADGGDICHGGTQTSSLSIDHTWGCESTWNSVSPQSSADPCGASVPASTTSAFPVSFIGL